MIQENEKTKIREFTDLQTWQEAHKLVVLIYKATKQFPKEELFGLTSQIRRAVISVTSNIAEGFGRQGAKEKVQFYYIAQGSLTEIKNQLLAARDIDYIDKNDFKGLWEQVLTSHRLLQGLIRKTKTFLNHES